MNIQFMEEYVRTNAEVRYRLDVLKLKSPAQARDEISKTRIGYLSMGDGWKLSYNENDAVGFYQEKGAFRHYKCPVKGCPGLAGGGEYCISHPFTLSSISEKEATHPKNKPGGLQPIVKMGARYEGPMANVLVQQKSIQEYFVKQQSKNTRVADNYYPGSKERNDEHQGTPSGKRNFSMGLAASREDDETEISIGSCGEELQMVSKGEKINATIASSDDENDAGNGVNAAKRAKVQMSNQQKSENQVWIQKMLPIFLQELATVLTGDDEAEYKDSEVWTQIIEALFARGRTTGYYSPSSQLLIKVTNWPHPQLIVCRDSNNKYTYKCIIPKCLTTIRNQKIWKDGDNNQHPETCGKEGCVQAFEVMKEVYGWKGRMKESDYGRDKVARRKNLFLATGNRPSYYERNPNKLKATEKK